MSKARENRRRKARARRRMELYYAVKNGEEFLRELTKVMNRISHHAAIVKVLGAELQLRLVQQAAEQTARELSR